MAHQNFIFMDYKSLSFRADPDNLKRCYDGQHEKESSNLLQTRSPHRAFCFGIDSANYGQPLRCEPQDSCLLFLQLRKTVVYELEAESEAMFGGETKIDERYFGGSQKGTASAVLRVKSLYLAY